MHWVIESFIWAGLTVGGYFGWFIMQVAAKLRQDEKNNKVELVKAHFWGLFIFAFCVVYAFFRFIIVLDYAMPTSGF